VGRAGNLGRTLDNGLDVLVSASAYKADGEDLFFDYGSSGISGVASGMDGEEDKEFYTRLRAPLVVRFLLWRSPQGRSHRNLLFRSPGARQYERDRHLLTQLQYQDSFAGDTLHLSGRLFLGRERYTALFSYGTPYYATGSSDWQGVEARLLSTAWAGHKLMVGIEYQDNSRRDQTNEDQVDSANNLVIPGSGWRAGVYAQDEWALGETLSATLGLRFDRNDVTGNDLSPRAALIWKASPNTTVKGLYGRAHRAPNAFERDYDDLGTSDTQVANPDLDGETIDTLNW